VADQLAADGFIAIAPDLLSGKGKDGGGTETFSADDVRKAVSGLDAKEVTAMLNAVRDYGIKLPAANGKTASIGFCWAEMTSFRYATEQPELNAAVVYYGTSPSDEALEKIKGGGAPGRRAPGAGPAPPGRPGAPPGGRAAGPEAPVSGHYGGMDIV